MNLTTISSSGYEVRNDWSLTTTPPITVNDLHEDKCVFTVLHTRLTKISIDHVFGM